jgi:hypothetical protein
VALAVLHLKLDLNAGMSEKEAYLSFGLDSKTAQRLTDPADQLVRNSPVLSARSSRYLANMVAIAGAGDLASFYGIGQLPATRFGYEDGVCPSAGGCSFGSVDFGRARWLPPLVGG